MFGNMLKKIAPTHFAQAYKLGHDKTFHLLEARRGRGKSFSMAYWALQAALAGVGTIANFHLNHYWLSSELLKAKRFKTLDAALEWCSKNIRFASTWDEFLLAYDCLVLVDEVNRLFDSQDRSKEDRAPKVVFEWLQLSRRNKITLVFAAQSMDWLTPRVRQLFDMLWRAKKEMGRGRHSNSIIRFWLYGADPWSKGLSEDAARGADFKAVIPFNKKYFRLYDTLERIIAIPNESRFERFWDVYQYQLKEGIIPQPSPIPPGRPRCGSCYVLLGHRAQSVETSAMREERSGAAPRPLGRHAPPRLGVYVEPCKPHNDPMPKTQKAVNRTFSLKPQAIEDLDYLHEKLGASYSAIVAKALKIHAIMLRSDEEILRAIKEDTLEIGKPHTLEDLEQ